MDLRGQDSTQVGDRCGESIKCGSVTTNTVVDIIYIVASMIELSGAARQPSQVPQSLYACAHHDNVSQEKDDL